MAKKHIGSWNRDPITHRNIYYVCECPTCEDKIYVTDWQLQQLIDNTYFHHSKFSVIIKNMVKMRIPKVRVEWGSGAVDNFHFTREKHKLTLPIDKVL